MGEPRAGALRCLLLLLAVGSVIVRGQSPPTCWFFDTGDTFAGPLEVTAGRVFYTTLSRTVRALNATTGADLLWTFTALPLSGSGVSLPPPPSSTQAPSTAPAALGPTPLIGPPLFYNGSLLVGVSYEGLYSLDATSGTPLWRFTQLSVAAQRDKWTFPGQIAAADGMVYVGAGDFGVYAIDAGTGRGLWMGRSSTAVLSGCLYLGGFLYVGFSDQLAALNATVPTTLPLGGSLPLRSVTHQLPRFSDRTVLGPPGLILGSAPPAYGGDLLYMANEAGTVYGIKPINASGRMTAVWGANMGTGRVRGVLYYSARVFFTDPIANLWALHAANGSLAWSFSAASWLGGAPAAPSPVPPLVAAGGIAFSVGEHIFAVHPETGDLQWRYRASAPLVTGLRGAMGRLYAGDSRGRLYALQDDLATGCSRQGWFDAPPSPPMPPMVPNEPPSPQPPAVPGLPPSPEPPSPQPPAYPPNIPPSPPPPPPPPQPIKPPPPSPQPPLRPPRAPPRPRATAPLRPPPLPPGAGAFGVYPPPLPPPPPPRPAPSLANDGGGGGNPSAAQPPPRNDTAPQSPPPPPQQPAPPVEVPGWPALGSAEALAGWLEGMLPPRGRFVLVVRTALVTGPPPSSSGSDADGGASTSASSPATVAALRWGLRLLVSWAAGRPERDVQVEWGSMGATTLGGRRRHLSEDAASGGASDGGDGHAAAAVRSWQAARSPCDAEGRLGCAADVGRPPPAASATALEARARPVTVTVTGFNMSVQAAAAADSLQAAVVSGALNALLYGMPYLWLQYGTAATAPPPTPSPWLPNASFPVSAPAAAAANASGSGATNANKTVSSNTTSGNGGGAGQGISAAATEQARWAAVVWTAPEVQDAWAQLQPAEEAALGAAAARVAAGWAAQGLDADAGSVSGDTLIAAAVISGCLHAAGLAVALLLALGAHAGWACRRLPKTSPVASPAADTGATASVTASGSATAAAAPAAAGTAGDALAPGGGTDNGTNTATDTGGEASAADSRHSTDGGGSSQQPADSGGTPPASGGAVAAVNPAAVATTAAAVSGAAVVGASVPSPPASVRGASRDASLAHTAGSASAQRVAAAIAAHGVVMRSNALAGDGQDGGEGGTDAADAAGAASGPLPPRITSGENGGGDVGDGAAGGSPTSAGRGSSGFRSVGGRNGGDGTTNGSGSGSDSSSSGTSRSGSSSHGVRRDGSSSSAVRAGPSGPADVPALGPAIAGGHAAAPVAAITATATAPATAALTAAATPASPRAAIAHVGFAASPRAEGAAASVASPRGATSPRAASGLPASPSADAGPWPGSGGRAAAIAAAAAAAGGAAGSAHVQQRQPQKPNLGAAAGASPSRQGSLPLPATLPPALMRAQSSEQQRAAAAQAPSPSQRHASAVGTGERAGGTVPVRAGGGGNPDGGRPPPSPHLTAPRMTAQQQQQTSDAADGRLAPSPSLASRLAPVAPPPAQLEAGEDGPDAAGAARER